MIKNIIFDMGNVLIQWSPKKIVARLGVNAEDAELLLREVFSEMEWVSMDHGIMTQQDGYERICHRLPERLHEAARQCVFDWWKPPLDPVPGMAELAREVRERGYGVYLCSNATSTLHEYFDRIPGAEYFEGKIVSADVALLKPQHEIYECLFDTFELKAEECFFIDDSPLNIDGAYAVGMPGAVYLGDMTRLRKAMRAAGIPVKE